MHKFDDNIPARAFDNIQVDASCKSKSKEF